MTLRQFRETCPRSCRLYNLHTKMADVTQEMILDYLMRKGGLVRNVDLVRHFKKYLQFESEREKGKFVAS